MTSKLMQTILLVVVATAGVVAQTTTFTREIEVSPGQMLDLRLETGGSVRIIGSDEASVRVEAILPPEDIRVEASRTPRGVEISSTYAAPRTGSATGARFDIRVPHRFDVRVESRGGAVNVADVEGSVTGSTMRGALVLSGLRGRVAFSTMDGGIRLMRSAVEGTVSTMNGNVLIEDVAGDVNGSSMGGNVEYRNVRHAGAASAGPADVARKTAAPEGAAREIRMSTMSGAIRIEEANAGADVSTMDGDVHIGRASRFARAITMRGDIQLDSVDGWIEARTMDGNVKATMVGDPESGDRHVKLTSWDGDITLTVPDGLDMRIDVTVSYTRDSRKDYTIQSEWPLELRRTDDWSTSDDPPRRYIYGSGTVGSGANVIEIEARNGNVTIRRESR